MAVTAVGDVTLKLQVGFPRWDFLTDRVTCQLLYKGLYETCLAQKPAVGSTMPEYGLKVDRAQVYGAPATAGYLLIEMTNEDDTQSSGQETQEVEWAASEIDLRLHPRYQTGGASALTYDDLVTIKLWQEEPDPALRGRTVSGAPAFQTRNPVTGATITLSTNALHLAVRLLRGMTHYIVPSPVARLTSLSRTTPNTTQCGKRVAKPFTACPDGYIWLGTADRAMRNGRRGKWRRDREFTGADVWDTDIYPT